jgi:hypothetical protein
MLQKNVPFLAWFHLQSQVGLRRTCPTNMQDIYPEAAARRQFGLHLAALGLLLPSPWLASLAITGGLCLALSAGLMEWHLLRAARLFRARAAPFRLFTGHSSCL